MPRTPQPPRERAARALCSSKSLPEDIQFEGMRMWKSFLPQVDLVLQAALSPEEWERLKSEGPDS